MDENRRYAIMTVASEICTTIVRVAAIIAIAFAFAKARGAEPRLKFDPYDSPPRSVDPKPRVNSEAKASEIVNQPAIGWHVHRCPQGHEWSHPDSSKGNLTDHTCPKCGAVTWSPVRTGVRLVEVSSSPWPPQPRATVAPGNFMPSAGTCPGGQCPAPRRRVFP